MSDAAAKRRARQTLVNLTLSLGATIGIMVLLILAVPRDDSNRIQPVDYRSIANSAAAQAPGKLILPTLPEGWYSNAARFRTSAQDGVANWYMGFVGPKGEFLAVTQGFEVNPTWMQFMLESNKPTGEVTIDDFVWQIYESPRENNPVKSKDYMLVLEHESEALFVYGVAEANQYTDLAEQISKLIEAN